MNDPKKSNSASQVSTFGRMRRLALKELREILRDRRTIATLVLMPIIVYPILSLALKQFLIGSIEPPTDQKFIVGFDNDAEYELFKNVFSIATQINAQADGDQTRIGAKPDQAKMALPEFVSRRPQEHPSLESMVASGEIDLAIRVSETDYRTGFPMMPNGISCDYIYRKGSKISEGALARIKKTLTRFNKYDLRRRLEQMRRSSEELIVGNEVSTVAKNTKQASLATLIPLVLILMTITGAVYPAIDLTAGERERGTLETLIAAPIPRHGILLAKFVAVLSVAMLTAVVNLMGMMVTVWTFQLGPLVFGDAGITFPMIGSIFLLLLLFAGFFSAILLAITSFARSFKEAQAYLIPVMLVAMTPGLLSLMPSIELKGFFVVMPLINIVLLARDVMQGNAQVVSAVVAIMTTLFYGFLAISIASKVFGTNAVLFGNQRAIGTLFQRPSDEESAAPLATAWFIIALLFPLNFLWIGLIGRLTNLPASPKLLLATFGTVFQFVLFPLMVLRFRRVRLVEGTRLFRPKIMSIVGAALLGVSLGILLVQLYSMISSDQASNQQLVKAAEAHLKVWKQIPFVLVALCMSLAPAVCEELFFRGVLFQSLRKVTKPYQTILITGIIFGLFHILSASSIASARFIPTALMGLILGWVCYKSQSVIPGMVLHTIHNFIYISMAYYRDEMVARNWINETQEGFPQHILLTAGVLSLAGFAVFIWVGWKNKSSADFSDGLAEKTDAAVEH